MRIEIPIGTRRKATHIKVGRSSFVIWGASYGVQSVDEPTIANVQTPAELVASHEITLRLKCFGVTDGQLEAMRFRPNQKRWPFDQWSFTWDSGMSITAIPATSVTAISLIKAYCALKWLILENPEGSRDKDDAQHLVSATMAAPIYQIGIRHKETQRLRAKKPRSNTTEDGISTEYIIEQLALSAEHREETTKELWPHFFSKLEEAKLRPKESSHSNPRQSSYTYNPSDGGPKSITFGRFANQVSQYRKKSR
jgi:hypothetical protein